MLMILVVVVVVFVVKTTVRKQQNQLIPCAFKECQIRVLGTRNRKERMRMSKKGMEVTQQDK
jgi:hypothetical protein